ncbi:MAG: NifB/NifX family molybdenum-iron cluster-binding protein [Deltaproteobacteria bacterium]|nr:NifB/NifX family molybdenum-iron cluster-binding protein [Deltaproteobacteria bacterium]
MKIAITASGKDMNANVDPRFGRAAGFVIYDTELKTSEYVANTQNVNAVQGAGIQSARLISGTGAKVLITGHCGPKAFTALNAAGIKIFTGANGSVREAVMKFATGNLAEAGGADVKGHWA